MMVHFRPMCVGLLGCVLAVITAAGCGATAKPAYDLVIRNGTVIDGSGQPGVQADVAIKDGKIAAIGTIPTGTDENEIDARGKVVSPGFIDVHTHVDSDIFKLRDVENFIRDGVTTMISGNCGGSVENVGAYLKRIDKTGAAGNMATLYGHNTVLKAVKGDRKGELTATQLDQARELVRKAMREGAVGLSTGLIYSPGKFSSTEEIIALTKAAGETPGAVYASHMRNESGSILSAIDEAVRIGREASVRVQISHFKLPADAAKKLGGANTTLGRVMEARKAGLEVTLDQYPYTASSTTIATLVPDQFLEDGIEKGREQLKDASRYDRVLQAMLDNGKRLGRSSYAYVAIASCSAFPEYNGLNVQQIAQLRKVRAQPNATSTELLRPATAPAATMPAVTMEDQCRTVLDLFKSGNVQCVFHTMDETEVETILRSPLVAIASDSGARQFGIGVPHPRGYGTNARVLGRYVRERKIISLEEAIRRMTSLPAGTFGFANRGLLKPGYAADVVVFDPQTVIDRSTFDKPHQYSENITDVIVNGVPVLRNNTMTGKHPGKAIYGPGVK